MKQYEIEEVNDWEGETFSYLVNLDEETFNKIQTLFEDEEFEGECYIRESNLTKEEVELINKYSTNGYMDRMQFATLKDDLDFDNLSYNEFPYKGNGLILED